jgi:hypothetical protein
MSESMASITAVAEQDWGSESSEAHYIGVLLKALKPGATSSVTPRMAARFCPGLAESNVAAILRYLSSERVGLFDLVFAVLDDEGHMLEIGSDSIRDYLERNKPLLHPISGSYISDPRQDVFIFFRGTSRLQAVLEERP